MHVPTKPCILLYDEHSNYVTADIIHKACANDLHLFILRAHSSYVLKPLAISAFSPFKMFFINAFH